MWSIVFSGFITRTIYNTDILFVCSISDTLDQMLRLFARCQDISFFSVFAIKTHDVSLSFRTMRIRCVHQRSNKKFVTHNAHCFFYRWKFDGQKKKLRKLFSANLCRIGFADFARITSRGSVPFSIFIYFFCLVVSSSVVSIAIVKNIS